MANPEAIYDILYIGQRLQNKMEDFTMSEIQFFSYLSCLLSLYSGNSIQAWNYSFIKSNLGSPYSSDIHLSFDALISNNSLSESKGIKGYYRVTTKGITALNFYGTLSSFAKRIQYLEAACDSISLIPFGLIKQAISSEPVLKSAKNSLTKRSLLEDSNPATKSLYLQFATLRAALNDEYKDLLIPAVIWLESLNLNKNAFQEL